MMTEQQLQRIMGYDLEDWVRDYTEALIAEVRRLKQELHEAEERAAGDDVTFKRLLAERTEADRQRDAALAERDEYLEAWRKRGHELIELQAKQYAMQAALTETRRVLREVLPVDCEHVHHPKRDQHPSDAACPVLTRASAVLAQEPQR